LNSRDLQGHPISIQKQEFLLLPQSCLFWPQQNALLLADLHLGKATSFRKHGVAVPEGNTGDDLRVLGQLIKNSECKSVYILGDFLHARSGQTELVLKEFADWRQGFPGVKIILIKGNHDRFEPGLPVTLGIDAVAASVELGDFVLQHKPESLSGKYVLAGHLHPAVRLYANGKNRQTLPCFHFTPRYGILPAFGSLTGNAVVSARSGDRVFVIADDEVIEVTKND
jgi:DNA ligase-associated metallophosphoesterase